MAQNTEKEKPEQDKTAPKAEVKPEKAPEISEAKLAQKRKEYLEAKGLRTKFHGRGEFSGKEGAEKLAHLGEEYNKMRSEYIRTKAAEELKDLKLPEIELKTKIVEKILEEYNKEEVEQEKLIVGGEKNLGQRFKEWWRRHPKSRMVVGYGLSAASIGSMITGQLWLTPFLVGARAAFAGTAAAMGAEGMLSRYSKKLGEKGMAGEFVKLTKEEKKELKKIRDKEERERARRTIINNKIVNLSAEDLAHKMAQARALQEKKGVKLEQAGPYGEVLLALRAQEQELLKQRIREAVEKGEKSKEDLISEAIDSGLEKEAREMDKNVEEAGDIERKKAIKRWVFATSAGAITAGLTAWWGFHRLGEITAKGKIAGGAAIHKEPVPEGIAGHFEIVAGRGDSVWKMAKRALAEKYGSRFTNLDEAHQTYVIDAIKDKIAKNPAHFGLTDIDRVKIGQKINFASLIKNNSLMEQIFGRAGHLTREQAENILNNNETLREFRRLHPGVRLDSENVDQIVAGKGDALLGAEHAAPRADIGAPEITSKEVGSEIPSQTGAEHPEEVEMPQAEEAPSPGTKAPSPETAPAPEISETIIQEIPDWTPEKIAKTTLPLIQKNPKLNTVKGILEHYLASTKSGEIFLPEQNDADTAIKEITQRTKELGDGVTDRYEKTLLENTKLFIGTSAMGRE